jgi:hypothetical protein
VTLACAVTSSVLGVAMLVGCAASVRFSSPLASGAGVSSSTTPTSACTAIKPVPVHALDPQVSLVLPNYGFGAFPAYLSGQLEWYGPGSQTAFFLVDPRYSGLLKVTALSVTAGSGTWRFQGSDTEAGTLELPRSVQSTAWRVWIGRATVTKPGCYAVKVASEDAIETIFILVRPGPPPND